MPEHVIYTVLLLFIGLILSLSFLDEDYFIPMMKSFVHNMDPAVPAPRCCCWAGHGLPLLARGGRLG